MHAIPRRSWRWLYIPINTNACYLKDMAMAIHTNQYQCMLSQRGHGEGYTYQSITIHALPMRPGRWLYIPINTNTCYPNEAMALAIQINQYQYTVMGLYIAMKISLPTMHYTTRAVYMTALYYSHVKEITNKIKTSTGHHHEHGSCSNRRIWLQITK